MAGFLSQHNRFTWFAIALLVVLNLTVLVVVWDRSVPKDPGDGMLSSDLNAQVFIERELGFDEGQKQEFAELRSQHFSKVMSVHKELEELHTEFYRQLSHPSGDSMRAPQIAALIGAKQAELDLHTFQHFREVRTICRPEQQAKFDLIIGDILQKMGPKSKRPGRPGAAGPGLNPGSDGPPLPPVKP